MIDYYSSDMERRKKLLESLTKRKDVLSKRRQKLIDCILDGKIDQDLYEEQISIVEVGLDNIVEDIDATQLDMNSQTDNIGIFVNLFRDISKLWKHAPLKLRQTLQEAMFNKPEWEHDGEDIIIRKYSEGLDSIS